MTETYRRFGDPEARRALMEQVSRSADATSELARRYLAIRHQCECNVAETLELMATSAELLQQLRGALGCYVGLLRGEGAPQDLAVRLVRDLMEPAEPAVDATQAGLLDDLERWARDVYDAA